MPFPLFLILSLRFRQQLLKSQTNFNCVCRKDSNLRDCLVPTVWGKIGKLDREKPAVPFLERDSLQCKFGSDLLFSLSRVFAGQNRRCL